MKIKPSLFAFSSALFCLLAPSVHAQDDALLDQGSGSPQRDGAAQTINITTSVSPSGAGTAAGGGTKAAGKSFTLTATPSATLKDVFLDWTVNGVVVNSKSPYTFTPAASETVVANFGYTITTSSSPTAGGKTTGAGAYPSGQNATVTATPNDCYDFTGWTKAGQTAVLSSDTSYTFPAVATEALVANFKLKEDQITTASSPVAGGTTTGAKTYGCDTTVTVSAKAANGYKFNSWIANNVDVSMKNPYSFEASGAEALTAVFEDISVPTVAFTSPKASESVTTPFLTISGTANNVLGVSSVVLTVEGVPIPVTTGNNWSNWTASVVLLPGANVISVYALSENNNPSKTETITVKYSNTDLAPFALAGLIAQVTQNGNPPFPVSFGTSTFEQFGGSHNQSSAVGNYTYTQTGANTATLIFDVFAPPNQTGQGSSIVSLTFTNPSVAIFTDNFGDSGTVSFSSASSQDFSSLSGWTIVLTPAIAVTGSLYYPPDPVDAFDPASGAVPPGSANSESATVILGPGDNNFRTGIPGDDSTTTADFNGNTLTVTEDMFGFGASPWVMSFTSDAITGITPVSDDFINGGLVPSINGDVLSLNWNGSYTPTYVLAGTYKAEFNVGFAAAPVDTAYFGDGVITNINASGIKTVGAYTSMQYGPLSLMVVETNIDPSLGGIETNYLMFLFTSSGAGTVYLTYYDGAGDPPTFGSYTFTGAYQASGVKYIAPASLNGYSSTVTQKSPQAQPPFNVSFGQATLAQTTSSTNNASRVSNYVYTRTGLATATLHIVDYLPPPNGNGNNGSPIYLTFTSPTSLTFEQPSGPSSGTITATLLSPSDYYAPAALPQGTFKVIHGGKSGSASFNYGNSLAENPGTYTYAQFSPTVGMLVNIPTTGDDAGVMEYVQLTFNSPTGGSADGDFYNTIPNDNYISIGTFTFSK